MNSKFLSIFLVLLLTVCFGATDSVQAQSIFLEPNNIPAVHLEALRPGFEGRDLSETTFALFLSGRISIGEGLQLRAEVPCMTFQTDYNYYYGYGYSNASGTKTAFGNPYVGLDAGNLERGFQVRFPLDKDLRDSFIPSYSISVGVKL